MDKPFSMVYEEFKKDFANLINNAKLPVSVIETILQNYLNEISTFAKNQYNIDKMQYDKFLSEKNEAETKVD